ncbi:unnamed protein product [Urochloa humidicola]
MLCRAVGKEGCTCSPKVAGSIVPPSVKGKEIVEIHDCTAAAVKASRPANGEAKKRSAGGEFVSSAEVEDDGAGKGGSDDASLGKGRAKRVRCTFAERSSSYRGVSRHRWTGKWEAHLWDNSPKREGRRGVRGRQGGFETEEKAARAFDLAYLKYWGRSATTNFPLSIYEEELDRMDHMTRHEVIAALRRGSSGFSRGTSAYRGVTMHKPGRWQANHANLHQKKGHRMLYLTPAPWCHISGFQTCKHYQMHTRSSHVCS